MMKPREAMHRKKGSQKRDLGIWLLADPAQALSADSGHKGTAIPLAEGLGVLGPRGSLSCLLRLLSHLLLHHSS